jgi:hypothetical protein
VRTVADRYEKSSDFFVVEHNLSGEALFSRYTDVCSEDEFERPTFEAQGERGLAGLRPAFQSSLQTFVKNKFTTQGPG